MCGISGLWRFSDKVVNKNEIDLLIESLKHRGPDGNGYWLNKENTLALIHNRLSILDLSTAAKQPMISADGRYVITLNGEIYNFIEIKEELKLKNYKFNTESDTEVILTAFQEWGEEMLHRFNGMWAFAIFDVQSNKLFLSRDRFGIKPLYYYYTKEKFIFASEIQAIHKYLGKDAIINEWVIKDIAKGGFNFHGTNETYLKDVYTLPGGYNLIVDPKEKNISLWYGLKKTKIPTDFNLQAEELKELLKDACKIRLRSDVAVGTCLSGGVDSGSITAIVNSFEKNDEKRFDKYTHRSFCAAMPNTTIDETYNAQRLSVILGSELDIVNVLSPSVEELEEAMKQCDGPMHALAFYPIWSLYRYIKSQKISVTLDGQGPDEMLGGYTPLYEALQAAWQLKKPFWFWDVFKTYSSQGETANKSSKADARYILKLFIFNKFTGLFRSKKKLLKSSTNTIQYVRKKNIPENALDDSLYAQFFQSPLPAILSQYDRCSMAHAVECRMPFMDYRIVEFIFSLPVKSKVGSGYTKRILREAMKGLLPDENRLNKTKIGFNAPIIEWFQGPLKGWMLEQMQKKEFLNSTYFDGNEIKQQFENFIKKDKPNWSEAWKFWPPVHITWWLTHNNL